jgi:voltage-gated potassium channel
MAPSDPQPSEEDLQAKAVEEEVEREQQALLDQLNDWLDWPLTILAFVWLVLFVVEVLWGLSPVLLYAGYAIWAVFLIEYLLGLVIAPRKGRYIAQNWLKALALLAPALRILRVARALRIVRLARVGRSVRLVRVLSSVNRGLSALRASMSRRGLGYLLASSVIVCVMGAAGMYTFERDNPSGPGLDNFGTALWWTAMIMTTMGSEYWPQTPEGRFLCLVLALYGYAVFGYVTASLATFFIGRDAEHAQGEIAGERSLRTLREEIAALREELGRGRGEAGSGSQGRPPSQGLS